MNRVLAIALAAAAIAAYVLPFSAREPTELLPVELLVLEQEAGQVRLWAGEDQVGRGATAAQAVEDLKARAPGEVWLEQTRYLLVVPGGESCLKDLQKAAGLRLACRVYTWPGESLPDPEVLIPRLEAWAREGTGVTLGRVLNALAAGKDQTLPELGEEEAHEG